MFTKKNTMCIARYSNREIQQEVKYKQLNIRGEMINKE